MLVSHAASGDFFGRSVWASGDIVLVGAVMNDDNGTDSGSACVFRLDGASWVEEQMLLASDAMNRDRLGGSVFFSNEIAIAGAHLDDEQGSDSGSAYVYDLGTCGDTILDAGEACDDGGRVPGDGCSATCQIEACSNGLDDDGFIDTGDPACSSGIPALADPGAPREASQCEDGIDNDGQLGTDFDAGESILGAGNGDPNGEDPQCNASWKNKEAASPGGGCGLGIDPTDSPGDYGTRRREGQRTQAHDPLRNQGNSTSSWSRADPWPR